jgi:hypothetical protein
LKYTNNYALMQSAEYFFYYFLLKNKPNIL